MERKRCAVVLCGHGIADPLVSTLILDYVLRLQEEGPRTDMLLVTEESDTPAISAALSDRLKAAGIRWAPLRYRVKGRQFPQKIRNLFILLFRALWFARGYEERNVIGFLSMAGAYASVLRTLGFTRSIIMNFEPHSQYMKDMGVWREGSFKYRVVKYFEDREVRNADVIIAPARAVVEHVRHIGTRAVVHEQGVTVDVSANARQETEGQRIRSSLGLDGRIVFVYAGKFNGIYHSEVQYARFMQRSCVADARIHHLVITFEEHAEVLRVEAGRAGVLDRLTIHGPVAPAALPALLSAADVGVIAVPPTPSQIYRSPVKTALYWAAGLPIIIAEGVSDDWWIAKERDIGIVVDDLPILDPAGLRTTLDRLLFGDRHALHERCARAAHELRDTSLMVDLLRRSLVRP